MKTKQYDAVIHVPVKITAPTMHRARALAACVSKNLGAYTITSVIGSKAESKRPKLVSVAVRKKPKPGTVRRKNTLSATDGVY